MFSRRTDWNLTPNRFTLAQRELAAAGREVIDLTVSNPTQVGLAYDSKAILGALARPESLEYDPEPKGMLVARGAVAGYYREMGATHAMTADSLILTTSTSEAYSFVFRLLCNPGDEILVPKPSYPLFDFLADLQDVKLVPYPLLYDHGWQIDFHSLQKALTSLTRAVVIVNPNNPTGSYTSESDGQGLNALCREHDLALIADEVFLDYSLDDRSHASFAGNVEALTFALSGLSKLSALPQMKVAWIAASGPQPGLTAALERLEVIADTYLSMNTPIQLATPTLLDQRKKIQSMLLERIRVNVAELDCRLGEQKACERLSLEGGWYAVLRVPVTRSDEDLAIEILRKTCVLVHPGHFYDFSTDGYLVLSLIAQPEAFAEGVKQVLNLVASL